MASCVGCVSAASTIYHGAKNTVSKIVDIVRRVMRAFIRILSCGYLCKPMPPHILMLHLQGLGSAQTEATALRNKLNRSVVSMSLDSFRPSYIKPSSTIAVMIRAKNNESLTTERVLRLLSLVDRIAVKKWLLVISAREKFDLFVPRYRNLEKIHKFCIQ